MLAPWEIKPDDTRTENTLINFIIFCEDGVDEPAYFKSFEKPDKNLKINIIGNQGAGRLNLNSTVQYCNQEGLIDFSNGCYKVKEGVTENIWCVYDRDLETEDLSQISPVNDIAFTTSIQTAHAAGLKVAWSNDSFELWILLHFETVPIGNRFHRIYIYDRLTAIFKNVSQEESPTLYALTQHASFNYKQTMKRKKNFITFVLPLIKERINEAISNAKALEQQYLESMPYHERNPCTKVHHLVQELNYGL